MKVKRQLYRQWNILLTHPLNEEVSVRPRDEAKVCVLEYVVHNPHDVVEELKARVEACHDEWHIRGGLVVEQDQSSLILEVPNLKYRNI